MGEVNSHGETGLLERDFRSVPASGGEQPHHRKWRNSWAFQGRTSDGESVARRRLGGGRGTVVEPSPAAFSKGYKTT